MVSTKRIQNCLIPIAAVKSANAVNHRGSMRTKHYAFGGAYLDTMYGAHTKALQHLLLLRRDSIDQVIFSYSTPIAWRDTHRWIIPNGHYSTTTSTKHQSQLYRLAQFGLGIAAIPRDCSYQEYMRVINDEMRFLHHPSPSASRNGIMRVVPFSATVR